MNNSRLFSRVLIVSLIVLVVFALHVAREVFIPLALALLVSFLLTPVVRALERWRFRRVPAVAVTVTLALGLLTALGYLMLGQLADVASKVPKYKETLSRKIASLKSTGHGPFSQATETLKELGKELDAAKPPPATPRTAPSAGEAADKAVPVEIVESKSQFPLAGFLLPLLHPLGTAFIVLVFVLFMLIKSEDLRDRIIHVIGRGNLPQTTQALDEAGGRVTAYLSMQGIVNTCFGVAIGTGLYFIGVPNAALWGLMAALLRFVPYVGVWISLACPLLMALAVSSAWQLPILTLALFAVAEVVTANVLEPLLYGRHTGLSPVAILVAAVFWTWLWGGVGLLLATPLTVCLSVVGRYIPRLAFLDALLGEEPTLTPPERYYQRLLAQDSREARTVVREYLKGGHTLAELYSGVLTPALAAAETQHAAGRLDERLRGYLIETSREIIEELDEEVPAPSASPTEGAGAGARSQSRGLIYCLPAAGEADEIICEMLAQTLEREGCRVEFASDKTLAREMVEQVGAAGATAVCISAAAHHATPQTRYLCKLLRAAYPALPLVVGFWGMKAGPERLARRAERIGAAQAVATLADALECLRPFAALETAMTATASLPEGEPPRENRSQPPLAAEPLVPVGGVS